MEARDQRECVREMGGNGHLITAALLPVSDQAHPGAGQIQQKALFVPVALCLPVGSLYGHMASWEIFPTLQYRDHYGHLSLQPRHNTLNMLAFHYICTRILFKSCTSIGRTGTTPALTSLYRRGCCPAWCSLPISD